MVPKSSLVPLLVLVAAFGAACRTDQPKGTNPQRAPGGSLATVDRLPEWDSGTVAPQVLATPDAVANELFIPSRGWTPASDTTTSRGSEELYAKVAPAVVVVRTATGHGSGFFVTPDGHAVTNFHVVSSGAFYEPNSKTSRVLLHVGTLSPQGRMQLDPEPWSAAILAVDASRDLALLLVDRPAGVKEVPYLVLGDGVRPGQDVAIIGHPSSGFLWSLRAGEVSALGESPRDIVNFRLPLLAVSDQDRRTMEEMLALVQPRRIVLTSCLSNPGDSGGPLVNEEGQVVGATFGIPSDPTQSKFTYHVDVSELKPFLKDTPKSPLLLVPDMWALGTRFGFPHPQILIAGSDRWEQMLFDLDGDTPEALLQGGNIFELVVHKKFDADFGVHVTDVARLSFYDRDEDGRIDLVIEDIDGNKEADRHYIRDSSGQWAIKSAGGPWFDPGHLPSADSRRALEFLDEKLRQAMQADKNGGPTADSTAGAPRP